MPSLPSRAPPALTYINDREYLPSPPAVPAHNGFSLSLSHPMLDAPSPATSIRSSISGGSSPNMLPYSISTISGRTGTLASTGNMPFDGSKLVKSPQHRRSSISRSYPNQEGLYSPTRQRFGGQHLIMGVPSSEQGVSHIGPDRSSRYQRRASQTQDENFPLAVGTPARRWRASQDGPMHYEVVLTGMFQSRPLSGGMTAVRFFVRGSSEPGIQVGSLLASRSPDVGGDSMFEGVADRKLDIMLSWPGIEYIAKKRLTVNNYKNGSSVKPHNDLAYTLANYIMEFAAQAENYPVHPNYEHLRLSSKGGYNTVDPRHIVIGGLYHRENSKWEIQMWIPRRRQM